MSSLETNTVNQPQNDDDIDLVALLWALLQGWKIILACALLGLSLGFIYSRYVQPTYQTNALVQIEDKQQGISGLGSNISELVGEDASPAETERELIKSRMILEPVVDLLHLDIILSDPSINFFDRLQSNIATTDNSTEGVSLDTASGEVIISQFDVPHSYLNRTFSLTATKTGFELSDGAQKYTGKLNTPATFKTADGNINLVVKKLPDIGHTINLTKQSLQTTTDNLSKNLSVIEQGKQTGIIQLNLTGSNQAKIAKVLEHIVLSYVEQNQTRGSEQTSKTIEFMDTQIPLLKQKLDTAEESFNQFREKHGTIDVGKEAELLLTEKTQINTQLNQLNLKKAELATFYTSEHPLVTQINEQLQVLQARNNEIKETTAKLPEIQREFIKLSQDAQINREIYLTMLKNYEQLKIARAGEIGYVRIVDMPVSTFEPIAPKKMQIWVLAVLLGSMLGALIVLLRSMLRNTVKNPEQLEVKTGVPVIATIPRSKKIHRLEKNNKGTGHLLAVVDHDSLSYEAIKSLRTFLIFGMPVAPVVTTNNINKPTDTALTSINKTGKIILITGESPQIGKSFMSANLAETFAQLNKKVLLIDADMRLGKLHKIFTIEKNSGLAEYLTQKNNATPVQDYIQRTSFDGIDLMPRGNKPQNPSALIASERFEHLMDKLRQQYDYIVIDSPPILAASEPLIIAKYADKVIAVARYNQSIEGQVVYAIKQMRKAGSVVDGVVVNDMTQNRMNKYSYNYQYAYGAKN